MKDGDRPPPDKPGALGAERPLGKGAVGTPRYLPKLREIDFRGPLNIEREAHDPEQRRQDLQRAVTF